MAIDLGPDGLTLGSTTINDWADVGGGKVLQVVTDTLTTHPDVATNINVGVGSFSTFGLSLNITPSSSSSTILIMFMVSGSADNGIHMVYAIRREESGESDVHVAVGDSATGFQQATTGTRGIGGNAFNINQVSGSAIDSPATTNQLTYSIAAASESANTIHINSNGEDSGGHSWATRFGSTLIAMEIAGS